MSDFNINDLTDKLEHFPIIPLLVFQISKIDPEKDDPGEKLDEIIADETNLKTKILKVINSIYYSYPDPISTLKEAVPILGYELIKDMLLAIVFIDTFSAPSKLKFDRKQLWIHSLAVSRACKLFAIEEGSFNHSDIRDFFIAGLLHDFGIIILEIFFPMQYVKVLKECSLNNKPYYTNEKNVLGELTHDLVGKIIANKWDLPEFLIEAINHHHIPSAYPGTEYKKHLYLLHLAHYAVELADIGNFLQQTPEALDERAFEVLKLDKSQLKKLTIKILKQKEDIIKTVDMLYDKEDNKKKKKLARK